MKNGITLSDATPQELEQLRCGVTPSRFKGDLRRPASRKDLSDRLPLYSDQVFGQGPVPSTNGHTTLGKNGTLRQGFRKGHMPTLDDYDRRTDKGVRTVRSLAGMAKLHELNGELNEISGEHFAERMS